MKIKKNQKGFGIIEILLVILILGSLAGIGYYVYSKNNTEQATESHQTTTKVNTNTPDNEITALRCGSPEDLKSPGPDFDITYTLPKGWVANNEDYDPGVYPNPARGGDYSSPDHVSTKAEVGPHIISSGAKLIVSEVSFCDTGQSLDEQLQGRLMVKNMKFEYIHVGKYKGIKYNYSGRASENNLEVSYYFKDNAEISVSLYYKAGSANPYPKVVDQVLNSIKYQKSTQ